MRHGLKRHGQQMRTLLLLYASVRSDIVVAVVDAFLENRKSVPILNDKQYKMLVDYGRIAARALSAAPGSINELNNDVSVLDKTIKSYQQHLEKNRAIYINIHKHPEG